MENNLEVNKQNDLSTHAPKQSIQSAFRKFQKQKFYQLKLNKFLKNTAIDRTASDFKKSLRQKFILNAQKYIGVPYARKFHQPNQPLYNAPLFLDCCGLIRQIIFDLRQEFGYSLAKWNQSYQFDLLPDQELNQKDLESGDLVFYSATYSNPKLKPFPHNMVHVEIYMGEGKSIGARWQKGTIQIFDSYKFKSTLYHDINFHYRSINSWLEGDFRSHCKEHKWIDDRANQWLSDKFSVFADPELDDLNIEQVVDDVRSVMVGKGNNSQLVSQYFQKNTQYRLMPEKQLFSPHFWLKWVQSPGQIDFYSFKQGSQLVNHIPNINIISAKLELLKTLHDFDVITRTNGKALSPPIHLFIPKTYRLDVMSDEVQFLADNFQGPWIYKPRNLNQGRGIRIVGDIKLFKKEFINSKKFYLGQFALNHMIHYKPDMHPQVDRDCIKQAKDEKKQSKELNQEKSCIQVREQLSQVKVDNLLNEKVIQRENTQGQQKQGSITTEKDEGKALRYSELKHDGLIQHYIRPLLLRNRKFDIRCYMLINSDPRLVLFHRGYLRLSIKEYNEEDIENQDKLVVHLTNHACQSKHKQYRSNKEQSVASWDILEQEIGKDKSYTLVHQIKRILLTTYAAASLKLMTKKGTYQLLGCDIIISENFTPFLLEVNTNPAMFTDTKVLKEVIPSVLKYSLDTAIALFEGVNVSSIASNSEEHGFSVLYCKESGQYYNSKNQKNFQVGENIEINGLKAKLLEQKVCNYDCMSALI